MERKKKQIGKCFKIVEKEKSIEERGIKIMTGHRK